MGREERQLVSFDWAMKRLLRQKANYVVLEGFLSELLHDDIKIQSFEDSESNKLDPEDKYNCVDILVKNSKDELILIEIQYDSEIDYFHRMLYGTSKLVVDYLNAGEPYENIKKIISVNLVYFDLGQGKDYIYWGTTNFKGIHHKDDLILTQKQKNHFNIKCVSDIYPEYYILKLNSFDDYAKNTLDEWVYTLKNGKLPANFKAKGLKEAKEVLDVVNMPEEDRADYNRYIKSKHVQASVVTSSIIRAEEAEVAAKEAEEKAQKAKEDAKRAEEKTRQAEADRKRAEEETRKAEAEKQKAEAEKKKVEAEKKKMVKLLKSMGLSDSDIQKRIDELS